MTHTATENRSLGYHISSRHSPWSKMIPSLCAGRHVQLSGCLWHAAASLQLRLQKPLSQLHSDYSDSKTTDYLWIIHKHLHTNLKRRNVKISLWQFERQCSHVALSLSGFSQNNNLHQCMGKMRGKSTTSKRFHNQVCHLKDKKFYISNCERQWKFFLNGQWMFLQKNTFWKLTKSRMRSLQNNWLLCKLVSTCKPPPL